MTQAVNIKVEPYWNVNTDLSPSKKLGGFIKVEPYWNVNLSVLFNCIPI